MSRNNKESRNTFGSTLLVTLAAVGAVSPLAIDSYLPAFTHMAKEFNVGASLIQLTMTMYLVGVALGQLLFGVLSDRYGRRIFLIGGTSLAVISAGITVIAPSIWVLLCARFFQGFGGAAGMVLGRAVIADKARGVAAAKAMSLVMAIQSVAPVLAPMIGGALLDFVGWRGIMAVVALYTGVVLMMVLVWVPESLSEENRRTTSGFRTLIEGIGDLGKDRVFVRLIFTMGCGFALLLGYLAATPFILQKILGFSVIEYTLIFMVCALSITISSSLAGALAARINPARQARLAMVAITLIDIVLGAFSVIALSHSTHVLFYRIFIPVLLFMHVACLGFMFGNISSLAIGRCGRRAGTGSAFMGFVQFILGGLASPLVGLSGQDSAVAFGITIVVFSLILNIIGQGALAKEGAHTRNKVAEILKTEEGRAPGRQKGA